jgi:hypothetical protein
VVHAVGRPASLCGICGEQSCILKFSAGSFTPLGFHNHSFNYKRRYSNLVLGSVFKQHLKVNLMIKFKKTLVAT